MSVGRVSLGIVIGRTACRVAESAASVRSPVYDGGGFQRAARQFYRPVGALQGARRICAIGRASSAGCRIGSPDDLAITVTVDGKIVQQASTANMIRPVARLLAGRDGLHDAGAG